MHIIVANEPRAYREVIAAALQALRPQVTITMVESAGLDEAVGRLAPQLVLCSRLTEIVETRTPGWVVLYPDGAAHVLISLTGQRTTVADIELTALLVIVDQTLRLAQMS